MQDQTEGAALSPELLKQSEKNGEAALHSYRGAAAVMSTFDSESLRPLDRKYAKDGDAVLDLLEECERVPTVSGELQWMLQNTPRREALKQLGTREAMQRALAANSPRPDATLQKLFEAYLSHSAKPLEEQTVAELTASLQVRDWLEGILDDLPDREALTNRLEWQQLLQPIRELVGEHFRGRTQELTDLHNYLKTGQPQRSIYQAKPLMIFGPGGVGKSTLLAKFILETVDSAAIDDFVFCYRDFDRAALLPEQPVTLLAECVLQLGLQFPQIKSYARDLRRSWLNELSASVGARQTVQTEGGERRATMKRHVAKRHISDSRGDLYRYLDNCRRLIAELPRAHEIRLLLVLDTFERVQEVSFEFTEALWRFLDSLQSIFPLMSVIVAGRAELSDEIAHTPYPLKELDAEATRGYLAARGITNPQLADTIFRRVGGDPLSLRLTVDGLKQDHGDLSQLSKLPDDFGELEIDHELNQGWLYRRYLNRIRNDPEIQRLAYPGLVLRRVTPWVIREVLAVPCKVDVPSDEVARDLFERLARQSSLVTLEAPLMLKHRRDVRKRMLLGLVQTEGATVFDIHRRAVDYYAKEPFSAAARAEEIYHRLSISTRREEIDPRWEPGLEELLSDAVDEIPPEMRGYLIARIKNTSLAFNWDEADARSKEEFVATRASDAITVNRPADALKLLSGIRDRLPGSKLYLVEAHALERLGRYAPALIAANEGLFSARKAGDAELELDLLLIARRANETQGSYARAVCLVETAQGSCTGFLVAPNLVLTVRWSNGDNVVVGCWSPVSVRRSIRISAETNGWVVLAAEDKELGYTLLRLDGTPGTDLVPGENVTRDWLALTSAIVSAGQGLFMLQQARGDAQMLEYSEVRGTAKGELEVATLHDEMSGGAGGAPCCNQAWQVVAVRLGKGDATKRTPLLQVIWARDLLADAAFSATLDEHLAQATGGSEALQGARMARLYQTMTDSFNYDELKMLSCDLGTDWEKLEGQTRSAKARSLVEAVNNKGKLDALVQRARELRPRAQWQ